MKKHAIVPYRSENFDFLNSIKESIINTGFCYSIADLLLIQDLYDFEIDEAIKEAQEICLLVGIKSQFHFKKIYVFDLDKKNIKTDWKMSKKGFDLVVLQFQKINQKRAIWLWHLGKNNSK
ncbi:MAG: hypothetical protein QG594_1968 [Bacteroidota bacterium]|nr:hypothetical protein [Bacteroidota bacterium]